MSTPSPAPQPGPQPGLSVVVVTPHRFAQLRRTVRCLRAQTVAERLELLVVAPSEDAIADHAAGELDGFAAARTIPVGPIDNVDRASAAGIVAASAPVVAIVEDHGYPEPAWAEHIIAAHADDHAAVGAVMGNANPRRMLSWANLLLAYGRWTDARDAGDMDDVPGHNISYKTAALRELDGGGDGGGDGEASGALADRLGRAGDLHDRLRARRARMRLDGRARIAHVNPSTVSSTAQLRFNAGRLYGAARARDEGWSLARRLGYVLAGPLIPLVRLRRLHALWFGPDGAHTELAPRVYPALLLALAFDAAGQMAGYARGPGTSLDTLATFEMDRRQHVVAADRAEMDT